MYVINYDYNWNQPCVLGLSRNLFHVLQIIPAIVNVSCKGEGCDYDFFHNWLGLAFIYIFYCYCGGGGILECVGKCGHLQSAERPPCHQILYLPT